MVQPLKTHYILIKNYFLNLIILLMATSFSYGQQAEFKPGGAGIGNAFVNYKFDISPDATQKSAFEIERIYLGYRYNFSETISGKVVFDVAYNGYTKSYTAFAKNAQLDWTIAPKIKLSAGLIGLKQFDTQEQFWGYRYIMKNYADQYNFGSSADLGINFELPISRIITFNVFVINGEGYKSLQDNYGLHRYGANLIVRPLNGLSAKLYYDRMPGKDKLAPADTVTISNISAFVGYALKNKFRVGIEYNKLVNGKSYKEYADNYTLGGFSFFGTYILNSKLELLARYDVLQSNKIGTSAEVWNYSKDGSLLLAGVQYKPAKGVNLALNYRNWNYQNPNIDSTSGIYLNLGFSF